MKTVTFILSIDFVSWPRNVARRIRLLTNQLVPRATAGAILSGMTLGVMGVTQAQVVALPAPLAPLKSIAVPGPSAQELAEFVLNKTAAIQLGKALFWETRVGSDNKTACATCHFHAGADSRITNKINPGLRGGDSTFQLGTPNTTLTSAQFPLAHSINDVVSSQGVFNTNFINSIATGAQDNCSNVADPIFHGGVLLSQPNTRRVPPRNSPSVINAIFNFRNFWDGRANNVFNGGDPFGLRNSEELVWKMEQGILRQTRISLPSSSLASQGSGPPLSSFEMSCQNRAFVDIGRKLMRQIPLSTQTVAVDDSVLASVSRETYSSLIRKAFRSEFWSSNALITLPSGNRLRYGSMDLVPNPQPDNTRSSSQAFQIEANFPLFLGLALQLYQSTLVADDTPMDRHLTGNMTALTDQQKRGMTIFEGQGKCSSCHSGAALTAASFSNVVNQRLERMPMADGGQAVYDNGFYNIGVRPTSDDIGVGGSDPFGYPLSETRMVQSGKASLLGNSFNTAKESAVGASQRVAVDGAFKTPGLRNVEFTGPYFHNGGKATLMQVVDFYNRGGDFPAENRANLAPDIQPLGLTAQQREDLVAFLLGLSDDRVRFQKAPFDHPSLCIPNGHVGTAAWVEADPVVPGRALDLMRCLPAIGAGGATSGLSTFLNLSPYLP